MTRATSPPRGSVADLTDRIAGVLRAQGFTPQGDRIAALVQAHTHAFIAQTLTEHGLQANTDSVLLTYLQTLDDIATIETVVRNCAGIIEVLRQEQELEEVLV
jgi:hypothetical protein